MTSGVVSKVHLVAPVWNVHADVRSFTLSGMSWIIVEKRNPPGSPPWYNQSRPGIGALWPRWPLMTLWSRSANTAIVDTFRRLRITLTRGPDLQVGRAEASWLAV